jgi:phage gp36-like protein
MAYSTLADLQKLISPTALIELSDDSGTYVAVDSDNIAEAIDQADREIDAYVGMVRAVPLATVPALITNLSAQMAIWRLHVRKSVQSDIWYAAYQECIELLKLIAAGKTTIGADDQEVQEGPPSSHSIGSRDQKFTSTVWGTY